VIYLLTVGLVCGIDQLTKLLIVNYFTLYQSTVILPGFFSLTYVTNRGAAFSIFADVESPWRHYFFVGIGIVALLALTLMWFKIPKNSQIKAIGLPLIAGGALGNLIDRIHYGEVIDFLDFYVKSYHWPAFNVADIAICTGVFLYIVFSVLDTSKSK